MAKTIQAKVENDPYAAMGEQEMLAKLKHSRGHCEEGRCREAEKVVSDLRESIEYKVIVTEDAEVDMGYGDYTKEKQEQPDMSLEEIDMLLKNGDNR